MVEDAVEPSFLDATELQAVLTQWNSSQRRGGGEGNLE